MPGVRATHHLVYIVIFGSDTDAHSVFDMLRYDSCCPADEGQSHKLASMTSGGKPQWVILKRFRETGANAGPSVERWKSFGWTVLPKHFSSVREAEDAGYAEERRMVEEAARRLGNTP